MKTGYDMPLDLILRVFHTRVQVVHTRLGGGILIEGTIAPSLPHRSHQLQIPETGILYQEGIFILPTGVASQVVTQLETQQQLQGLQRSVLECEVTREEGVGQLGPGRTLTSCVHHRVIVVREAGAEIYHGALDQLPQGQFLGVCLIQTIEGYLVDEEVTDDLVGTRITLVDQVRSVVFPLLLCCYEVLQDLGQISVPQVQDRVLVLRVIIEFISTTDHLLLAVLSMPEEQAIGCRTVLSLHHISSGHKSLQSPLGGGRRVLPVLCPVSLLRWLEGILRASTIGGAINYFACIHTKEPFPISCTTRIGINGEGLSLLKEFLAQFLSRPRTIQPTQWYRAWGYWQSTAQPSVNIWHLPSPWLSLPVGSRVILGNYTGRTILQCTCWSTGRHYQLLRPPIYRPSATLMMRDRASSPFPQSIEGAFLPFSCKRLPPWRYGTLLAC